MVVLIILFYINLPQFIKIILLIFSEGDCRIPRQLNLFSNPSQICPNTLIYHQTDKISDTIIYSLLLFQIYNYNLLHKLDLKLVLYLFIYRLVGIILYFITQNRKYLIYFANFFLWITLTIFIMKYFKKNYKNFLSIQHYKLIFTIVAGLKLIQEIFLHSGIKQDIKYAVFEKIAGMNYFSDETLVILKDLFNIL
tara:strand:- start:710 stop:1294 length:585 start_codon:yes stop_codon:yes gene_type:complete